MAVVKNMEKRSRVNKYRELRESIKEDASLPKQNFHTEEDEYEDDTPIPTLREYRMKQMIEEVKELDNEKENELDKVQIEDKEIEEAISRVRMTSGKGKQYNTRLDILNHIQANSVKKADESELVAPEEFVVQDFEVEEPKEEENISPELELKKEEEPVVHFSSFLDKEEIEKDSDPTISDTIKPISKDDLEEADDSDSHHVVFEETEDDDIEDDEDEEQGSSIVMKILTGLIFVLSICLVALLIYIVKLFLFQ